MHFATQRLLQALALASVAALSVATYALTRQNWTLLGALPALLVPALLYEWAATRHDA